MLKLQVVKNLNSVRPVGSSNLTSLYYNPFKLIPDCTRAFAIKFTQYAIFITFNKNIRYLIFPLQYINFVQVRKHHEDVDISTQIQFYDMNSLYNKLNFVPNIHSNLH